MGISNSKYNSEESPLVDRFDIRVQLNSLIERVSSLEKNIINMTVTVKNTQNDVLNIALLEEGRSTYRPSRRSHVNSSYN